MKTLWTISLFVTVTAGIVTFAYIVYVIQDVLQQQLHQGLLYTLLGIYLLQVGLAGCIMYAPKKLRGENEVKTNIGC